VLCIQQPAPKVIFNTTTEEAFTPMPGSKFFKTLPLEIQMIMAHNGSSFKSRRDDINIERLYTD
jgi:hypothetical protein